MRDLLVGPTELEVLFNIEDKYKGEDSIEDYIEDCVGNDLNFGIEELLINFKEEYLKEELFKKMQELRNFDIKKDLIKSNEVLKDINDINKSIQNIKNGRLK